MTPRFSLRWPPSLRMTALRPLARRRQRDEATIDDGFSKDIFFRCAIIEVKPYRMTDEHITPTFAGFSRWRVSAE